MMEIHHSRVSWAGSGDYPEHVSTRIETPQVLNTEGERCKEVRRGVPIVEKYGQGRMGRGEHEMVKGDGDRR